MPPVHKPLALLALILSRTRSDDTSRSNWAKDSSIFKVSFPMEVDVSKAWVIETKLQPYLSNSFIILWKSIIERDKRSTL